MNTLGERIRMIRKSQKPKMNQDEFAKSLGVTLQMVYTYENDRVVPNDAFKMLLCKTYHVNPRWLETGEGEMADNKIDSLHELVEFRLAEHDEFTRRTIEQFLKLPQETREQIFRMMRAIVGEDNEDDV